MRGMRLRYKLMIIVPVAIIVVAAILFIFRVQKVTVDGITYISDKEFALMYSGKYWQKSVITMFIADKMGFVSTPSFVREQKLSYPSYGEVHISVKEKQILAGVKYAGRYIYFDKDGLILAADEDKKKDIPYFETDDVTSFSLFNKLELSDDELLPRMLNLSYLMQTYEIEWDKARFDENGKAILISGDIKVLLGKKDNYDEAVSNLSEILKWAKKSKKSGEIDMSDYVAGANVIFKEKKKM